MHHSLIMQLTEDGSHTIAIPELNITYHSKHGAVQESRHVFIEAALGYFNTKQPRIETINIFEVGFGTGLNALLSLQYAIDQNKKINYQTIEPCPLTKNEAAQLNYTTFINQNLKEAFYLMHSSDWNKKVELHNLFSFKKIYQSFQQVETGEQFHIIYFDAFDPNAQPELWTEDIFKKLHQMLFSNGILATYCSKSAVQNAMKAAGFIIEKLKGPPGKREIVRAARI